MSKMLRYRVSAAVFLALFLSSPVLGQPSLTTSGYKENFDSMGSDGTSPPDGWVVYTLAGGSGTFTAATGIPANSISLFGLSASQSAGLTATLNPASTNNNGFNAATSAAPNDRALTPAPTGVACAVLELTLTNNTGVPVTTLSISYDIRRFTVGAGGADELPGFWLFYSLDDGFTYENIAALNTDINSVPNTVGVTRRRGVFNLSSPLANGANIIFRWVDDNGGPSSPDQIMGLDNVSIPAAPNPPAQSVGIRFSGPGGPPESPAMDPSEVAGVVPRASWNNQNGAFGYGVGPLNDGSGVAIAGTVLNYGCNNTWNTGIADAPGDSRLMGAYLDSNTTDYTVVIIQGLSHLTTSDATYDVYLYINGDGHGGRHGFYSVGGGFGLTTKECIDFAPFDPAVGFIEDKQDGSGGNYLHFTAVSGDTLFILATAQNPNDPGDNGFRAPLNAIQIVAN
jgi:hypothetical protein